MKLVSVKPSTRDGKRLMVILEVDGKTHKIHFGSEGASTFLEHGDEKKKENYLKRHIINENWTNPLTAGFWAKWLLWTEPTLEEAIRKVKKRFDL